MTTRERPVRKNKPYEEERVFDVELKKVGSALDILARAYALWNPSWIFLLYSGGYDSVCSTHIAWQWAKAEGIQHKVKVISADTGVAADGWREYVARVASAEGWRHEIWDNPNPEFYYENVREFGFPHTKQMHWQIMYRNLKERIFDAVRAAHKTSERDRCMLVSGMRREESTQRANTPEWLQDGAGLWVSPLVEWTEVDVYSHRASHGFEPNPFYEQGLGSGDCECNWGQFVDLETLEEYSPQLAAKIRPVHEYSLEVHGWGYGERPSKDLLAERAGQITLPGIEPIVNLCASCGRKKPDGSRAAEWRDLQNW